MQTIYIDVLLVQSFYVNYFLLRAAAKLTHTPLRLRRCLAAAAGSGLFSLLILLPPLPALLQVLCKLGAAAVTVTLAFGWHKSGWLRKFCCFFCCNFLLAGLLLAVSSTAHRGFATWGNSYYYLDLSLMQLILFTALAYFVLHAYGILRGRLRHSNDRFQVFVRLGDKTAMLPGLSDTGNRLTDAFSGVPVIVCSADRLAALLGDTPVEKLHGYRLAACHTVTAEGILPLFRSDEVWIRCLSTWKSQAIDVMIGIDGTQEHATFHPDLLGSGIPLSFSHKHSPSRWRCDTQTERKE
ncbi:MAG: sigma-E processing peptidase SpoIIGA [Ruminococcus sp.]|nr:sigma-E processing peptidase SpoIIGA [Ruminococcus sp.]